MKRNLRKVVFAPKYLVSFIQNKYFNETIKEQEKDYKNIPILIISYNQLHYLKQLINFLLEKKYRNIVIIDNASTYKPLLQYFDKIEPMVKIHRLSKNWGHRVLWQNKKLFADYMQGYYAVTDADIVPNPECPEDFMLLFKKILDKHDEVKKVGFSLRLDDIPEHNPNKRKIIQWEQQFWEDKNKKGYFIADIDTTFALYRPANMDFVQKNFYRGIRTAPPYVALHGGWYINPKNLTAEQQFYMKTANESSSWRIDEEGNVIDKQYE